MATRTKTVHTSLFEGGDAKIEEYLDGRGITYEFLPNVAPSQFDSEKSLRNQARFIAVDEARVEAYAESMKNGDKFPPVIAYGKHDALVVADGNHRLQAAIKANKSLGVYLLGKDTPGQTVTLVMHEANAKHGLPTSEEERVAAALYLMDQGANVSTAAAALSLPRRILNAASAKRTMDQRFHDNGIAPLTVEKLGEGVKRRLSTITTDEGFVLAVGLCLKAHLSSAETNELVNDVNESRSASKQVDVVHRWTEEMSERIGGSGGGAFTRPPRGPKARVNQALGTVLNLDENLDEIIQSWQEPEREEAAKRMRAAARRLNEMAKALQAV